MKKIILLHLLLSFSCKNILSTPEEQKKIPIPSDEKLITLLYEKISKDDFSSEKFPFGFGNYIKINDIILNLL